MTKMTDSKNTAPSKTFAVHYCRTDRTGEVFIELISAENEQQARSSFERVFSNVETIAVRPTGHGGDQSAMPGARFINGRLHAVDGNDEWPSELTGLA